MNDLSQLEFALLFAALFFASKVVSTLLYQICWRNAVGQDLSRRGPTSILIARVWLWPLHAVVLGLINQTDWIDLAGLRTTTVVIATLLTWGAVFRFGSCDRGSFFVLDRAIAVAACTAVYFHPCMLYPCVMVVCCLQYTVSDSALSPGYSNLLGFEFVRGSACVLLTCFSVLAAWSWISPLQWEGNATLVLSVLIAVQASQYVNHALAKSELGPRWYSWMIENRLECLIVNSYLRGWGNWIGKSRVLSLASWIGRVRTPLCIAVWALEFAFLFVLWDRHFAAVLLVSAAIFHVAVLSLTGLAELEYVANHANLVWILWAASSPFAEEDSFGLPMMAVSAICILSAFGWVGLLRRRMLAEFQLTGMSRAARWADPLDHLMAWWDSPYMRMFTYSVTTTDGKRYALPVTKLSPYDTSLTDIHTHIMILNAHPGFDPQAEAERQERRNGVWGLMIDRQHRDAMDDLMNDDQWMELRSSKVPAAWRCETDDDTPAEAVALRQLFRGMNHHCKQAWFRFVMKWPHFPGEDLAPDICPLVDEPLEIYAFQQPIASVLIQRVKTFYTGNQIHLIERSDVGIVEVDDRTSA